MSAPATSAGTTGTSRPWGPWRVVVLPVAAVAFALLGIWFSGAALPTLLRDPGAVVRWGLPASSTLSELAGSVTVGALFLAIGILPRVVAATGPPATPARASAPPTGPPTRAACSSRASPRACGRCCRSCTSS